MWNAPAIAACTCGSIAGVMPSNAPPLLPHLAEVDMRGDAHLRADARRSRRPASAPTSVLPNAPPIERRNSTQPVAAPTSRWAAAFCTQTRALGITMPTPNPRNTWKTTSTKRGVSALISASRTKPTTQATMPAIMIPFILPRRRASAPAHHAPTQLDAQERHHQRAGGRGIHAAHQLEEQRQQEAAAEQREGAEEGDRNTAHEHRVGEQPGRQQRIGEAALLRRQRDEQHEPGEAERRRPARTAKASPRRPSSAPAASN